jgi:hypothetical protein
MKTFGRGSDNHRVTPSRTTPEREIQNNRRDSLPPQTDFWQHQAEVSSAVGGSNGKGLTYANPIETVLDALKVDLEI